jgi:tRNA pseudouridine55 synthase
MPRNSGSHISGLLNIDKPQGLTSHDVVARIRKLAGQHKVGHAGTLDPLATGVLVVCLGQATRLMEYLMLDQKEYRATIRFGVTTDTLDAEGKIVAQADPSGLTEGQLRAALSGFLGEIEQVPPVFSALKQGGKPLYRRARAGQAVTVEPRPVRIGTLAWVAWQPPDLTIDIVCSAGTYIRSLARDLGEAVGLPAYLAGLRRTASGKWSLADAVALEVLEREVQADETAWQRYLHPIGQVLTHLPGVTLTEELAEQVRHGRQVELETLPGQPLLRAYTPTGDFLAILTRNEAGDKLWQPKKVFKAG